MGVGDNQLRSRATKRDTSGNNLVCNNSQRIEITATINPARLGLFGRDVLRRPHKDASPREPLVIGFGCLGDAEIGQHYAAIAVHHNIVRLHIAMDCAGLVGIVERRRNRFKQRDRIA